MDSEKSGMRADSGLYSFVKSDIPEIGCRPGYQSEICTARTGADTVPEQTQSTLGNNAGCMQQTECTLALTMYLYRLLQVSKLEAPWLRAKNMSRL